MIVVHVRAGTQKWSRIGANGEGRRTAVGRLDGETILSREVLDGVYREYREYRKGRNVEKENNRGKGRRNNGDENDQARP